MQLGGSLTLNLPAVPLPPLSSLLDSRLDSHSTAGKGASASTHLPPTPAQGSPEVPYHCTKQTANSVLCAPSFSPAHALVCGSVHVGRDSALKIKVLRAWQGLAEQLLDRILPILEWQLLRQISRRQRGRAELTHTCIFNYRNPCAHTPINTCTDTQTLICIIPL